MNRNRDTIRLGTGIDSIIQDLASVKLPAPHPLFSLMPYSTIENQRSSPLLRLPGELRNQIYEYALSGWQIQMAYSRAIYGQQAVYCRRIGETEDDWTGWIEATQAITALPVTCRQLCAETQLLPFTLDNEFTGKTGLCLQVLMEKLGSRGRKLSADGRVTFDYNDLQ